LSWVFTGGLPAVCTKESVAQDGTRRVVCVGWLRRAYSGFSAKESRIRLNVKRNSVR